LKRTLKRESKGLEVVKMETNGFSTDRGANQGVTATKWVAWC
jgi:hypothetical protein